MIMDQKTINKIHLCLNEMQMVKQLIDSKAPDDFCSRLLGIYVMLRVDDITKIWSHNLPKASMERIMADGVKTMYNDGLRVVRDKLGAHYQTPEGKVDLFASLNIFKSIDYANTTCIIDAIIEVEGKIEGKTIGLVGFVGSYDFGLAKEELDKLHSDDKAYLTNGALDVLGLNKGGLILTTEPQVKGQNLRSIELMVGVAYSLLNKKYVTKEVERLFKRLYVCMVYNYHDNLITRKDISTDADQYEEGFDILYKSLLTDNDDKSTLLNAFDDFEKIYQVEPFINKNRKVRDHACAHFDEKSTVDVINKELDALDIGELKKVFDNMLCLFNYLCNHVFCLKMLSLPVRSPIYGAQMETVEDLEDFYGQKPSSEFPKEMTNTEIMRSIRQKNEKYGEACDTLVKRLMNHNDSTYQVMVAEIAQRLREPAVSNDELSVIFNSLRQAKQGDPLRLQRTIIDWMNDNVIFNSYNGYLLWLLSSICGDDPDMDVHRLLDSIIVQKQAIPTALSILALLHLTVEKNHSCIVANNKAHVVSDAIKNYCDSVTKPTEKCALMLMLLQQWMWNSDYEFYRRYEINYTTYLQQETEKALEDYFKYIKLNDTEEREYCEKCLKNNYLLLLLYRLAYREKVRKQKPNQFLSFWQHNCFVRTRCNMYEAFAVGLLTELEGNKEAARDILEEIRYDNPIHQCAIDTLADFYKRNPDLKNNNRQEI